MKHKQFASEFSSSNAALFRSVISASEQMKRTECFIGSTYRLDPWFLICLPLRLTNVKPSVSSRHDSSEKPGGVLGRFASSPSAALSLDVRIS